MWWRLLFIGILLFPTTCIFSQGILLGREAFLFGSDSLSISQFNYCNWRFFDHKLLRDQKKMVKKSSRIDPDKTYYIYTNIGILIQEFHKRNNAPCEYFFVYSIYFTNPKKPATFKKKHGFDRKIDFKNTYDKDVVILGQVINGSSHFDSLYNNKTLAEYIDKSVYANPEKAGGSIIINLERVSITLYFDDDLVSKVSFYFR